MSKIEWTDETWNPVIGCSKASPGCDNCYAERMAKRQWWMNEGHDHPYCQIMEIGYSGGPKGWNGKTAVVESALTKPLRWAKARKIFVCSMGDLFHESVPTKWLDRIWDIMAACPQHTFQILTKRPARMLCYTSARSSIDGGPLPHIWLGTSVENQAMADHRIPHLLKCPAAVRFVSVEPMLGPVDLSRPYRRIVDGRPYYPTTESYLFDLDWVICGGESGPNARPMHPDWARSLRDQCQAASVPFMFKQWGEWAPNCLCTKKHPCTTIDRPQPGIKGAMFRCGKKAAGRKLDGVTHDEFPEDRRIK